MQCFHVTITTPGENEADCYVFAQSAGKARWVAVRGYCEAYGCRPSELFMNGVRSGRAPDYDTKYRQGKENRPLTFDAVLSY